MSLVKAYVNTGTKQLVAMKTPKIVSDELSCCFHLTNVVMAIRCIKRQRVWPWGQLHHQPHPSPFLHSSKYFLIPCLPRSPPPPWFPRHTDDTHIYTVYAASLLQLVLNCNHDRKPWHLQKYFANFSNLAEHLKDNLLRNYEMWKLFFIFKTSLIYGSQWVIFHWSFDSKLNSSSISNAKAWKMRDEGSTKRKGWRTITLPMSRIL